MKSELTNLSENEANSFKEYKESYIKDEIEYSKSVKQMPLDSGGNVFIIDEKIEGPYNKRPSLKEGWEEKEGYGSEYFYYCKSYVTLTNPRYKDIISKLRG
tara:strand:- start:6183 stop:6485 length:303 start_codon:yes stop_codon:yes gene_type:complete